jgi:nitroimidazol reductase NimA-like FMN-containing flavoprotein (pyridoxamine 5'-phosphate oxidase superfamily)
MTAIDLQAFLQMVRAAAAVDRAYTAAMAQGPVEPNERGSEKAGSAWRVWLLTSGAYREWLDRFGLTPKSRGTLPQPTAMPADIHAIDGGKYG